MRLHATKHFTQLWQRHPNLDLALLAFITLLGLAFRLYRLGEWGYWIDEIYTVERAQTVFQGNSWRLLLTDALIGLFLTAYKELNEWSARFVPAIIGVLSIPILYFPVKKLLGPLTALTAVALLAVSSWHIFWSQNARFYTLLLLLYSVALLIFYRGVEKENQWYILIALILFGVATRERLFAAFFVPVIVGYLFLLNWLYPETVKKFPVKKWLPILLIPFLIYTLYDAYIFASTGESSIFDFFRLFLGNPNKSILRFFSAFVYRVGVPTLFIATIGSGYVIVKKDRLGWLLVIASFLPPAILTLASAFVGTVDRYVFTTLFSWLLLAAMGIKEIAVNFKNHGPALALALFLLLFSDSVSQNLLYYEFQEGARPNWKDAYALVESRRESPDIVYSARPVFSDYYLGTDARFINTAVPQDIVQNQQRVWFIISSSTTGINPDILAWIQENSMLVEVLDVHIPGKVYDMRVYLYDPTIPLTNVDK